MKKTLYILLGLMGLLLAPSHTYAQEEKIEVEESAELFLEEYSDDFQENFFEGLKQKGIENYDKAINLFLECKRIDENNTVIDHELANAYLLDKQYILAQDYGLSSLNAEPENLWYLSTLVKILQKQGRTLDAVKSRIPYENEKLQENLALLYYKWKNYQGALNILKGIKKTSFTKNLTEKINDSLEQVYRSNRKAEQPSTIVKEENPLEKYKTKITELLSKNDFPALEEITAEALENFPAQPYFYYANGLALNKNAKYKQAISVLESALDYMLDDAILTNKIHKELANAHMALGNISKANMYLSKIKSGS